MRNYIVSMVALSLVAVGCGDKEVDTSDTGVTTTETGTNTTDTGTNTTDTGTNTTDTGSTTTDTGSTTTDTGTTTSTGNTAPGAPVIEIVPGEPGEEDDLVCTIITESSDSEGDAVDYAFSWENNGTAWAGFTKDTVYTGDTIGFRATADGDEWTCIVVPTDGMADGDVAEVTVTIGGSDTGISDTGSSDTALFTYYWDGAATITSDGVNYTEWNGTESFVLYNLNDSQIACEEAYDATSTTTLSGCSDCDFAFDVTYSDSIVTGPGCTTFGLTNQSGAFNTRGWGFASTYTSSDGSAYSDVLMYYSPNDATWFGVSLATKSMNGNDVDLAYQIISQYYFYYYTY